MKPVFVRVLGYVLQLEDDCLYVGTTLNLNQRLSQHWDGDGAKWTALHKPRNLLEVVYDVDEDWENLTTLTLMEVYGREKVRGGCYCRVEIEEEEEDWSELEEVESEAKTLSLRIAECNRLLDEIASQFPPSDLIDTDESQPTSPTVCCQEASCS